MSNIRGINDLRRQQEAQRERQRLIDGQEHPPRQYPILGYGFELGTAGDARKESFGRMLTLAFCPHFRTYSFIFIISCVQIVIYFITVFYDFDSDHFLEPTNDSLDTFGAKDPERMKEDYELWRWFTPMLLHAIAIYVGSGFGGVLFSCLVSPDTMAVGASTAIFGIITAMIAWIMFNWSALENDLYRTVTLIWLIILLVFNLLMGFVRFT